MSKSKKKRTKPYTGRDAAHGPVVRRYTAEVKSPVREWWDGHKRAVKFIAMFGGGGVVLIWLLVEFARLVF